MKNRAITKSLLFAAGIFGLTSLATAQVFEMQQVQVLEGTASVDVEWTFTYEWDEVGDPVSSVGFDVTFDEVILTDVDLDDCIIEADSQLDNCVVVFDGDVIRISISNLDDTVAIGDANGILRFTIDPGATVGDVSNLPTVAPEELLSPEDTQVDITSGSVEIVDAPPEESVLNVQPPEIDFGGQQTGTTSDPQPITISNDGTDGVDLEVTGIDLGDGAHFAFEGGGSCPGTPFTLSDGESCTQHVEFSPQADGGHADSVTVTSDADEVTNDQVDLLGEGTEAPPPEPADLSIAPPSGDVNLGSGSAGDVLSTTAVISNTDSAEEDGTFTCTLDDPSGVFDASPLTGTVPGDGGSQGIDLSCTLPSDAEDGDSFGATFACDGSEGFSSEHALSCSVSEFEAVPVPTMQKWSLILFALMMLIAGGIGIRFFRA